MKRLVENNPFNIVLKSVFWLLAIILGAIQTWSGRYLMWPDGPSYLDIADNYLSGSWGAAINACWSPLYSWVLGIALFVFKPSPYWELFLVKSVNFLIYLLTLLSFDFFLRQLMAYSKASEELKKNRDNIFKKPDWMWILIGYTIFIWSSIVWLLVHRDSPDMMVAGFVYLATAFVLRIVMNPLGWHNYVMLGGVLGLSYLSKTFMLPLGFAYIVSIICISDKISLKISLLRVSSVVLVLSLFALPFVTAISLQKQRITIGDAGRLNYAWNVSPLANDHFWQGSSETGTPIHSPRVINKEPEIQEYSAPVSGSYPVWYDPSYWNDGIQPKFNLKKQLLVIVDNFIYLSKEFLIFFLFFFLFIGSINEKKIIGLLKNIIHNWRLFIPAMVGVAGFISFINLAADYEPWFTWQTRYLAPFFVLFVLFVFYSADINKSESLSKILKSVTIIVVVIANIALLFQPAFLKSTIEYPIKGVSHYYWEIANELDRMGVEAGDKVALLGTDDEDLYWARLAKVKIIASMSFDYLSSSEINKRNALKVLKSLGVTAIIQTPLPPWNSNKILDADWEKIGKTDAYIYRF